MQPATQGPGRHEPRLRFSEVVVHPNTDQLWLLSAVDLLLLVIDRSGAVIGRHFFPADEMPQPEGAGFLPDGRLVLASEGVDGPAWLRIYDRYR